MITMKKLSTLLVILLFAGKFSSQMSTFVVNNYSSMTLEGNLHANSTSGSCYPRVLSAEPNALNIIVPSGSATVPSTVSFKKYAFANDPATNFPLSQWWVQTTATSAGGYRPVGHVSLSPSGIIATNTKWTGFYFVTKNGTTYYEEHFMGDPAYYSCTACLYTYNNGGYTEAEWFSIGDYTYVQVY